MAVVVEGARQRIYLPPSIDQIEAANVPVPDNVPEERLAHMPRDIKAPTYGLARFSDLFTNRQLTLLTGLADLIAEIRRRVLNDALTAGMERGSRLADGGCGAAAYADAVATYLGFVISKVAARNNTMCTWESGMDRLRGSFQRQAIPMTWDFAEANPLSDAGGGIFPVVVSECEVLDAMPVALHRGEVSIHGLVL